MRYFHIFDDKAMSKLQDAYDDAVKKNLREFEYEGATVLTDYIKYILMYSKIVRADKKKSKKSVK